MLNAAADSILPRAILVPAVKTAFRPQVPSGHALIRLALVLREMTHSNSLSEARLDLGNSIGVNLRNAVYNPVDETQIEIIRTVLPVRRRLGRDSSTGCLFRNWDPWDSMKSRSWGGS